jgi:hypothetical protein
LQRNEHEFWLFKWQPPGISGDAIHSGDSGLLLLNGRAIYCRAMCSLHANAINIIQ